MRFAYLDDSGLGNIEDDPYVVVAGVIVNADSQIKPVEKRLGEIKEEFFSGNTPKGAIFHGVDIYQGQKHFSKHTFSFESRLKLLTQLAEIPKDFDLPVVMGAVDRRTRSAGNPKAVLRDAIKLASAQCVLSIELYMRSQGNENCFLVYENTNTYKSVIKEQHEYLRSEESREKSGPSFPLERIVETAHFAEKSESAMLQVADAAAFTFNRMFRKLGKGGEHKLLRGLSFLSTKLIPAPEKLLDGTLPGVKILQVYPNIKKD